MARSSIRRHPDDRTATDPESSTATPALFVPRPVSGPWDVTTLLLDFAIVTYAVTPEALAWHLPPGFEPDTFVLADGRRVAFVSAVPFRDRDFRFGFNHAALRALLPSLLRVFAGHLAKYWIDNDDGVVIRSDRFLAKLEGNPSWDWRTKDP
ncbi:DUF2071 domain-containing protein [Vitiosangium sp. GDMCC 1.1324]|uniref:DUF2071 domain-containing protein n=1 Tax=Vitiosangium sp. (strain GDMCC 1.1324) TaxID=2138576 RepID=UPI00130DB284|nr:DUF2071 domain-containing protein [Vitiosangium sp. GDMCC 1.1324]